MVSLSSLIHNWDFSSYIISTNNSDLIARLLNIETRTLCFLPGCHLERAPVKICMRQQMGTDRWEAQGLNETILAYPIGSDFHTLTTQLRFSFFASLLVPIMHLLSLLSIKTVSSKLFFCMMPTEKKKKSQHLSCWCTGNTPFHAR